MFEWAAAACAWGRPLACASELRRDVKHAVCPRQANALERDPTPLCPLCAPPCAAKPVDAAQAGQFRDLLASCLGYARGKGLEVAVNVSCGH